MPNDRQLLMRAASAIRFQFVEYVPAVYPGRAGLLYEHPRTGRLMVWNPMLDDGEAMRLLLEAPAVDVQKILEDAQRLPPANRAAYMRGAIVRAVGDAGATGQQGRASA